MEIELMEGGLSVDDRGAVGFVNNFDLAKVRRFYVVENYSRGTIRAFHGHRHETKWVTAVAGTALVIAVRIRQGKPCRFVLSATRPSVLRIPPGYANGFRSLQDGTRLMFFSDRTLAETRADDVRLPWDHWGKEIWQTENR